MAAVSQCRALAGSRAMRLTYTNPNVKAVKVCNGTKWTMKRKDSYMVEVRTCHPCDSLLANSSIL
jgi:hypothetical protein